MNQLVKTVIPILTVAFAAWFFMDERYIHTVDAEEIHDRTNFKINKIAIQNQLLELEIRLDSLDSRIDKTSDPQKKARLERTREKFTRRQEFLEQTLLSPGIQ